MKISDCQSQKVRISSYSVQLKSAHPHIFKALSNLDGDSDVLEENLDEVMEFVHQQIAGII